MPAAPAKKRSPEYAPPELPSNLDPASTHSYYMAMADWHDKEAWKNNRLSRLKPLWSSSRMQHDDKHQFHRAMRDGFAQKALAIDLASPMDGASGFQGMRESLNESSSRERIVVDAQIHTLEEFIKKYGSVPLDAIRTGKVESFTIIHEGKKVPPGTADKSHRKFLKQIGDDSGEGYDKLPGAAADARTSMRSAAQKAGSCWGCGSDWFLYGGGGHWGKYARETGSSPLIQMKKDSKYHGSKLCPDCFEEEGHPEHLTAGVEEAFGGIAPTGALATINGNKTHSERPLQASFPTAASSTVNPTSKTLKTSVAPMEATTVVACGASPSAVLEALLSGRPLDNVMESEYRTPNWDRDFDDPSGSGRHPMDKFEVHFDKIGEPLKSLPDYSGDLMHPYPSHTFTYNGETHRVSMDKDDASGSGAWPPSWFHGVMKPHGDDVDIAQGQGWKSFHKHIKNYFGSLHRQPHTPESQAIHDLLTSGRHTMSVRYDDPNYRVYTSGHAAANVRVRKDGSWKAYGPSGGFNTHGRNITSLKKYLQQAGQHDE